MDSVQAWHPDVPQVQEVLHAAFETHAYPAHTHDSWAVMVLDEGAVRYDLHRTEHIAVPEAVTLLPPGIPHNGRTAVEGRVFRKRVIYLDADWLPWGLAGAASRQPSLRGSGVRAAVARVHGALHKRDPLAAEGGLHLLQDALAHRLGGGGTHTQDVPLARRLRSMLDDLLPDTTTVAEAAAQLDAHPNHLVRVFTEAYGIPPHTYVTGRRVDAARRLLLSGTTAAEAAVAVGFHDQPHMSRHFRRVLGATPGAFRSGAG